MAIRIVSKKDGFWRCGVRHSSTPTIYPNNRFTRQQLAELQAEPMLIVDVLPDEKPTPPKGRDGKGKEADPKGVKAGDDGGKEPDADSGKGSGADDGTKDKGD